MTLLELAERCEREGPSIWLDLAIHRTIEPLGRSYVRGYSTSLDAAVAFVERSDPQAWWSIDIDGMAKVCLPDDVFGFSPVPETPQQFAPTPALALVAAALRALAARDGAPKEEEEI
jgi:hypothetical protein